MLSAIQVISFFSLLAFSGTLGFVLNATSFNQSGGFRSCFGFFVSFTIFLLTTSWPEFIWRHLP